MPEKEQKRHEASMLNAITLYEKFGNAAMGHLQSLDTSFGRLEDVGNENELEDDNELEEDNELELDDNELELDEDEEEEEGEEEEGEEEEGEEEEKEEGDEDFDDVIDVGSICDDDIPEYDPPILGTPVTPEQDKVYALQKHSGYKLRSKEPKEKKAGFLKKIVTYFDRKADKAVANQIPEDVKAGVNKGIDKYFNKGLEYLQTFGTLGGNPTAPSPPSTDYDDSGEELFLFEHEKADRDRIHNANMERYRRTGKGMLRRPGDYKWNNVCIW